MTLENSLILISNNSSIEEILKPKLVLLREVDNIISIKYEDAIDVLNAKRPDTVLLYCDEEKEECLTLINKIKNNGILKDISILLVLDKFDQDVILSAYDEEITDYTTLEANDIDILIRTIWSFKKNSLLSTYKKQVSLLKMLGVIDKDTNFYSKDYAKSVFDNEMLALRNKNLSAIMMLIGVAQESRISLPTLMFAKIIKSSVRHSDIVMNTVNDKFLILLPSTELKRAFFVYEKIKKVVGEQNKIVASVISADNADFESLEKQLIQAQYEVEASGQELKIIDEMNESSNQEETSSDWLQKIGSSQKNFKLFKQAFSKKLEKVINPVFFQVQKLYEERLFETKIEQYSTSTVSEFILKTKNAVSELRITYPGFSKINIDIIHQGLDSPENRRISLDLTELTEETLTKILEDFIVEFKNSNEK